MKIFKLVISIFLLLTYSLWFAHTLVPHCQELISGEYQTSHHHHKHHQHQPGEEKNPNHEHVLHENHFDAGVYDLILCILSETEHPANDCNIEHYVPGHHWGTDIDLNSLENEYFQTGYGLKVYNWLVKNALVYGFYQPYTDKEGGRNGFEEEKWHWSYFPLADDYLHCYSVDTGIREFLIGFKGNEYYQKLNILEDYVKGVEER